MKKDSLWNDYLTKYAASIHWQLYAAKFENIEKIVVIPAYAEREMLFATLASIAANSDASLEDSLILCVINNKVDASDMIKENNSQTIQLLNILINKQSFGKHADSPALKILLSRIADRPVRLGYIDASSNGMEIPARAGGVGMARKIGMDMALRLFRQDADRPHLICSLDADTLVQPNYLSAIQDIFSHSKYQTGIVAYEHQMPSEATRQAAICCYEIFLRYWVLGLQYARSPYAYHSIGSTIVTTADTYLSVRGMNRREAGEDFYFLNKLAKIGQIHHLKETVVYPSARVSARVPFGTGAAVQKIISGSGNEYYLYDTRIFVILKEWLDLMKQSFSHSENQILSDAQKIDSGLGSFLIVRGFLSVWPKIRRNINDRKTYETQFHNWFDGFETLKLVNHLTREYYPRISMLTALRNMLELLNRKCVGGISDERHPGLEEQLRILHYLRDIT